MIKCFEESKRELGSGPTRLPQTEVWGILVYSGYTQGLRGL
jgi:hypothetical protein